MNETLRFLDTAEALLASLPTRAAIAACPQPGVRRSISIRVDRTMPFEFIASLTPPFCGLWEAGVRFDYSAYDVAMAGIGGDCRADAYIVWLDWRSYSQSLTAREAVDWLDKRIGELRGSTDRPVLVNNWPQLRRTGDMLFSARAGGRGWFYTLNACLAELIERSPGCHLIDLAALAHEGTGSFYDGRNEEMSGYPLSAEATILAARHLGAQLLPAALAPRLKAIVLDLDDTLYGGVLGEDGPRGLTLSEGHDELQKLLLRLKNSGMLLAICSRNEERDVEALFAERDDFPLKRHDFAAVCANWQPKADNLNRLAQRMNIDASAILFVDDNPAELLGVAAALPGVRLLRAGGGGRGTAAGLSHYPGLYQLHPDDEASHRTADIQANQRRDQFREAASGDDNYLESLKMKVTIYENEPAHAGRLYDLSRKTNQFNLALRRMTEAEAIAAMDGGHYLTVTVRLADLLSDSGIIGAFVCRLEGAQAHVIETVFSCRALGRDIETVSFAAVLDRLAARGVNRIAIDRTEGPRNAPALEWLKRIAADSAEPHSLNALRTRVKDACRRHPAKVEVIQ